MKKPHDPGKPPSQRRGADPEQPAQPGPENPAADPGGRDHLDPRQLRKMAGAMQRLERRDCLLCGGPPHAVGWWQPGPNHQRQLHTRPERSKVIGYTLCRRCQETPGILLRVEAHILETFAEVGSSFGVN